MNNHLRKLVLVCFQAALLLASKEWIAISAADALFLVATNRQTTNHSSGQQHPNEFLVNLGSLSRVKKEIPGLFASASEDGAVMADDANFQARRQVRRIFFALNAATKWLVSIAVTAGVVWNPKTFRGPFIVVGGIGATVLATKLKRLVNQKRPEGAPFTDPGMPSSHALVSFFVANAWRPHLQGSPWTMVAATVVSVLRVLCGYHTVPQIAVGGLLGTLLGFGWTRLGGVLDARHHQATFVVSWATYLIGSALYVRKEVVRWFTDEKFL